MSIQLPDIHFHRVTATPIHRCNLLASTAQLIAIYQRFLLDQKLWCPQCKKRIYIHFQETNEKPVYTECKPTKWEGVFDCSAYFQQKRPINIYTQTIGSIEITTRRPKQK